MMIFPSSFCYSTIAGTLLLLVIGHEILASSKVTIDHRPLEDGSSLAQLCDSSLGKDMRISRISSIALLHGYFNSMDNVDTRCRNSYLEPLNELKALLDLASENICSFEVMKGITNFHWRYIVGGLSSEWRKASNESSPEPIRMFFMNYAQEVTKSCRHNLERRLERATSGSDEDLVAESLYTNKFGPIINQLSNILHPQNKIKKYGDFLLLWDQLIDRERMKGRSIEQKIDSATGEKVLLSLKAKQPEKVWPIQKRCREELQPIYKETVLPVMKLISIGYGGKEERSHDDVADSELVKNWYAITQFCELVLPVNFYLNKGSKKEQVTVLSPEESANLEAPKESLAGSKNQNLAQIINDSIRLVDVLPNSNQASDKLVKSNLKARGHIYRRVIRNAIKMTNGQFKSKLKDLFISKKVGDNKYVVETGESTLKRQLAVQERELLVEDDNDDVLENSKSRRFLFRSKRDSLYYVFKIFVIVCVVAVVAFFMYMLIVALVGAAG